MESLDYKSYETTAYWIEIKIWFEFLNVREYLLGNVT